MKALLIFFLVIFWHYTNAQEFTSVDSTIRGSVNSLTVYNNELYAGGIIYKSISGGKDTFNLMKWNGQGLVFIKNKILQSEINALITYRGCLYIGIKGSPYIGRWNGKKWDSVYMGGKGGAKKFAEYNGELYIYSEKDDSGALFKWNGKTLSNLTVGRTAFVQSIAVFAGKLYISGIIDSIKKKKEDNPRFNYGALRRFISWDGKAFNSEDSVILRTKMSLGEFAFIHSMSVLHDTLFISFEIPHDMLISYPFIAFDKNMHSADNGETYRPQTYYNDRVNAMCDYDNKIYAGGSFGNRTGTIEEMVATWENNKWTTLIKGLGPDKNGQRFPPCNYFNIEAMCVYKGDLYVGGENVSVTSINECCKINCIAKLSTTKR